MADSAKPRWAWALYDAGNSAFATVVMAGFFPLLFKTYWSAGADVTLSTAQLGMANAGAGLAIALLAPVLGAVADRGGTRKRFLAVFTGIGTAGTAALVLVEKGCWPYAAALYVAGVIGFSGANIFYDALLPSITDKTNIHRTSALGYSLGYLGGGLLFALCVVMMLSPGSLGLVQAGAQNLSFIFTALWWGVFTIPLMLYVTEPGAPGPGGYALAVSEGLRQLRATFRAIRKMKTAWLFLLAYWFYIDGVNTIIRMAIDYGLSLGFSSRDLIVALLITQFVGFPSALVFGRLGERWGVKKALYTGIAGYLVIVVWGVCMRDKTEFYILAVLVGLFQGGIQALSRSYYSRLIPRQHAAQFFGFYNMVGKFSAILGPALVGLSAYVSKSPRAGIASIALFFIIGGVLLSRVGETTKKS